MNLYLGLRSQGPSLKVQVACFFPSCQSQVAQIFTSDLDSDIGYHQVEGSGRIHYSAYQGMVATVIG